MLSINHIWQHFFCAKYTQNIHNLENVYWIIKSYYKDSNYKSVGYYNIGILFDILVDNLLIDREYAKNKLEKYYKISLDKYDSAHNLANFYHDKKLYELAKKYYKLGIGYGQSNCALQLATLFAKSSKISKIIKYYKIGITLNNGVRACYLAKYYSDLDDVSNKIL